MRFIGTAIADLEQGNVINGIYILRKKELKETSGKKLFADLFFIDQTGEINGKIWDMEEEFFQTLTLNQLYYINAKVDSWKDKLQLNINRMRLADPDDQKKIGRFVPSAPLQAQDMMDELYSYANRIQHTEIKKLVLTVLERKQEKLMYYPAARSLHHSIRSGLLYHWFECCEQQRSLRTSIPTSIPICCMPGHCFTILPKSGSWNQMF